MVYTPYSGLLLRRFAANDRCIYRLYAGGAFAGDREPVEHLFGLCERLVAPLVVAAASRKPLGRGQR
jgi:hypothetical protein